MFLPDTIDWVVGLVYPVGPVAISRLVVVERVISGELGAAG
jgi:hypothetical protein